MKNSGLILISCFGLGSDLVRAQAYIPFPDSNAEWYCQKATADCFMTDPTENQVYAYEVTGDTLLGGQTYHKLVVTSHCVECCDDPLFLGYAGAFRNDTVNRQVYLVLPDSVGEVVWYDFSAQLGDTMIFSLPGFLGCGTSFTLTEIDSILVAGTYRDLFRWTSLDGCWNSEDVEGMGSLNGLFERNIAALDINGFLHCFKTDGQEVWSDGLDMCSIPMAVGDPGTAASVLQAFFQDGAIVLTRSGQVDLQGQVTVFDPNGRVVHRVRVTGVRPARITVPGLRPGLYLVQYRENNGPAEVVRLIHP